jgi:acyl carrier protein
MVRAPRFVTVGVMHVTPDPKAALAAVVDAIRASARHPLPNRIEPQHRVVDDLGYDSLGIVHLSVALEERLGHPILLDGWIGSAAGPSALTVGSLAHWITLATHEEHGAAVGAG